MGSDDRREVLCWIGLSTTLVMCGINLHLDSMVKDGIAIPEEHHTNCPTCQLKWPAHLNHPVFSRRELATYGWLAGTMHESKEIGCFDILLDVSQIGGAWDRYWLVQSVAGVLLTTEIEAIQRKALLEVLQAVGASAEDPASDLAREMLQKFGEQA